RPAPPPSHRPLPASVSLEALAREKFLNAETTVTAATATVYVPTAYAGEAALTGDATTPDAAGRRTATGDATLVLRRLTVRAARVTLVIRPAGEDDLQLTARGRVSFRSSQPGLAIDERDLASLFLRNDGYTPLR